MDKLLYLLECICAISSPSGDEGGVTFFIKKLLSNYPNITIEQDVIGNLIVRKEGLSAKRIMFCAHCDEIGLSIKYIDESGFLRINTIGGVDLNSYRGHSVVINHLGNSIEGVIGIRPPHWAKKTDQPTLSNVGDLWVDIGATSREEAMELVSIGDTITFNPHFEILCNNTIVSKSIDNSVGVSILLYLIEILKDLKTEVSISFVFSVQEEIGLRGAVVAGYNEKPDLCIVVDVTHATDYPSVNKNAFGDIRIGKGPVIPIGSNVSRIVQSMFETIAENKSIPTQKESIPSNSGTDIAILQLLNGGRPSGLISIPCRYMHSDIETVSQTDIANTAEILKTLITSYPNIARPEKL